MSTKPDMSLRLTLKIRGKPYVLTVTCESFKLVLKGKREGVELPWSAFLEEDTAMLSSLYASIRRRLRSGK